MRKIVLLATLTLFTIAGFADGNLEEVIQPAALTHEKPEQGDVLACALNAVPAGVSEDQFFAIVNGFDIIDSQQFVESLCRTNNPLDAMAVIVEGTVTVLNQ